MSKGFHTLPPNLGEDIDVYEGEVQRFLADEMPGGILKAKRVPRGVYEQRKDGAYMVRVRVAGGTLTVEQSDTLAALATAFGNGLLHVTTRQDVQLHDIAIEDTPAIMRRLMDVGLTSKGGGGNTVRNVTACPYAGICPCECFDVTPFAHAVTEYLISLVGSYNLPRKYKIAFSGCPADCALAQVADLGFLANVQDGEPGFRVVAGGGMGANSRVADELLEWIPASEVIRVAEAIRRVFDALGDRDNKHRARLRYVFERLGADAVRERFVQEMAQVAADGVPVWKGEVTVNPDAETAVSGPLPREAQAGIRVVPQRQEAYVAVPLNLPLGFVSAEDFAKIGQIAQQFSTERGPRTTRLQNMLIRCVPREKMPALTAALGDLSIDVTTPAPLDRFVACAGASTCRLGLCLARDAARACANALAEAALAPATLDALDVYINGCPNACGHQPVGPIGLSGAARRHDERLVPSYRVSVGGRCNANGARLGSPVGKLPARALPAFLCDVGRDFETARDDDETFSAYVDRQGAAHFEAIVERHAAIPSYADQPEYYRDFGAKADFSLAGRGAGECGSGVFEVIQRDIAAARKAKAPFDVLLPTVRALLITRGVDAREPDIVLREFEKHFVDTGLVDAGFRDLLSRARGFTQGWQAAFEGQESGIEKLLERITLLYETLDAGLEFHPPEREGSGDLTSENATAAPGGSPGPRDATPAPAMAKLDLSGVPCPMNFVKAKLRLESMAIGESLALVLDSGAPVENVPASLRNEGQTVESITEHGDGQWHVVVTKRRKS